MGEGYIDHWTHIANSVPLDITKSLEGTTKEQEAERSL